MKDIISEPLPEKLGTLHELPDGLKSVVVRPIRPEEESRWNELMATHHYLGFRTLVGESMKYVAVSGNEWLALLGWGTAAFKAGARDKWIGWSQEHQWPRLKFVANNHRFLILPGWQIKNLASKALALNLKRLSADWEAVYGHPILLAETFVDLARFKGTCYRAAGWQELGATRGYGRRSRKYFHHGQPKAIWVRPLHREARQLLSAPFDSSAFRNNQAAIDLNHVSLDTPGGLLARLETLQDPRKRRGIRHSQASVLAVGICATLAGARSFLAIGDWAGDLPQDVLRRLKCRRHPDTNLYISPSEPTLRRTLQAVDPDELDILVSNWLAEQADDQAVAFDGKTLRGSKGANGKPMHLMAALLHKEGVVIAQRAVDEKSNEITAARPLLEPVDLRGKVVTADAMHTQTGLASFLVEKKGADYLFTVKGNQATLLDAIKDLDEDDFSPSVPAVGERPRPHRNT